MESFKDKCKKLGVNYHRALKRRQAGLPAEKVFGVGFIRNTRAINEISIHGVTYPNLKEAVRKLNPVASRKTIGRLLKKGVSPEAAFEYVPNPGYANGIIYCVTHKKLNKKYVGLTMQTLERRWQYHLEQSKGGCIKSDGSLHSAIRQYGPAAFEIIQIDNGLTKKGLEGKERTWIRALNTLTPNGYNISSGGVSGGSNKRPVEIDGLKFDSVKNASKYLAESRGITLDAARKRISVNRVYVRKPAKPGESLVKSKCYKAWSRIVHGALNSKSKEYIPNLDIHEPWREFDAFHADVGDPPDTNMAFTRLNKELGFFPDNCLWLSKSEVVRGMLGLG